MITGKSQSNILYLKGYSHKNSKVRFDKKRVKHNKIHTNRRGGASSPASLNF